MGADMLKEKLIPRRIHNRSLIFIFLHPENIKPFSEISGTAFSEGGNENYLLALSQTALLTNAVRLRPSAVLPLKA